MASPRSYYLIQSAAAFRKPEVQAFIEWLRHEARAEAEAGAAAEPRPAVIKAPGRDSADSKGRARA